MHPRIASIARKFTYPYLKDGIMATDRPFPRKLQQYLRRNVGVLHADHNATCIGTSWQSETEAWGAVNLAWELTRSPPAGYHYHDITILTRPSYNSLRAY